MDFEANKLCDLKCFAKQVANIFQVSQKRFRTIITLSAMSSVSIKGKRIVLATRFCASFLNELQS
jgi:hypothetical protein